METVDLQIPELSKDPSADARISITNADGVVQTEVWYRGTNPQVRTTAYFDSIQSVNSSEIINTPTLDGVEDIFKPGFKSAIDIAEKIGRCILYFGFIKCQVEEMKLKTDQIITDTKSDDTDLGINQKTTKVSLDENCKIVIS